MLRGPPASGLTRRRRALAVPLVGALAFGASLAVAALASAADIEWVPRPPGSTGGSVAAMGNTSSAPGGPSVRNLSLELAARIGLGLPLGNVDGEYGDTLNQTVSLTFPVWLEAGIRFRKNWQVGVYLVVAPGTPGGGLSANGPCSSFAGGCSVLDTQLGLFAHYHVLPDKPFDPWLGLGGGYEILSVLATGGGPSTSGWTALLADAGLDIKTAVEHVTVGPFVTVSLGQYDSFPNIPTPITTIHGWVMLGARGAFDIPL
jgi:hypothetical protein